MSETVTKSEEEKSMLIDAIDSGMRQHADFMGWLDQATGTNEQRLKSSNEAFAASLEKMAWEADIRLRAGPVPRGLPNCVIVYRARWYPDEIFALSLETVQADAGDAVPEWGVTHVDELLAFCGRKQRQYVISRRVWIPDERGGLAFEEVQKTLYPDQEPKPLLTAEQKAKLAAGELLPF